MPSLFGYRQGVMGGSGKERRGLLREADGGALFLDEVDELGLDEHAMIPHSVETGRFFQIGSDQETTARFQLITSVNTDLAALVAAGSFRSDLHARLSFRTFRLPALRDRPQDIDPNIDHELAPAEQDPSARKDHRPCEDALAPTTTSRGAGGSGLIPRAWRQGYVSARQDP